MTLVTHQTGPAGQAGAQASTSRRASEIARELYLALTLDRASESFAVIASTDGGMDIEEVAAKTPGAHPHRVRRSDRRPAGLIRCRKIARALALDARAEPAARRLPARALPAVHREGRVAGRDQPARRHEAGRAVRARRQAQLRRQRALPARGHRRAARPRRRGPARARRQGDRPRLRRPRRRHRLHGERRRPRDGDARHDHRVRRAPGELPRRRRRRRQGEGQGGLQADPARPEGEARSWSTSSAASCAAT